MHVLSTKNDVFRKNKINKDYKYMYIYLIKILNIFIFKIYIILIIMDKISTFYNKNDSYRKKI